MPQRISSTDELKHGFIFPSRLSVVDVADADSSLNGENNCRRQITGILSGITLTTILLCFALSCMGSAGGTPMLVENNSTISNDTTQSAIPSNTDVTVTVNGGVLQNGSRITTGEDPRLGISIRSTTALESVLVRIDGRTQRTYSPNDTKFSTTTTLNLRDGGHRVSVIAVGNTTTVHSTTIVEDAIAPRINFEEPFVTTGLQPPEQNYTLNTSNITLSGELTDRSSVQRVVIKHRYEYTFNGEQTERSRYVIDDPGNSFTQQLTLGPNRKNQTNGTNYVTVETTDAKDNHRKYTFVLNISDQESPDIEILKTTPLHKQSAVALKIQVTDNVGISLFGRQLGSGNTTGLHSYYSENNIYKQQRKYTTTVEIPASLARNGISLWATDLVGNNATLNYSISYADFVSPNIVIDTQATQRLGDQTARVVGTIDQGQFSNAEIEARLDDGTLSDIAILQADETTSRLEFNESLYVDSYPVTVQVRVQDVAGTEHIQRYQITRPDPQQTSQPTPNVPTETVMTPPQSRPTTTEKKGSTPTLTPTQQQRTTQVSTRTATATQNLSIFESLISYFVSILPYTLGSAFCTVVLYVIARRTLAN